MGGLMPYRGTSVKPAWLPRGAPLCGLVGAFLTWPPGRTGLSAISQAALWMAGWLAATLAMTVAGRELGRDIPVFVLMLLRSLIATAILAPIVLAQGDIPARLTQMRLHIVRNL